MKIDELKTKMTAKKVKEKDATEGVITNDFKSEQEKKREEKFNNSKLAPIVEKIKATTLVQRLIALGLVIMLVLGAITLHTINLKKKDKVDFYTYYSKLVSQELGSFKYRIKVHTEPNNGEVVVQTTDTNIETSDENTNTVTETEDVTTEAETDSTEDADVSEENTTKYNFVDWEDNIFDYWQYPDYVIEIEGCTMSTEPLTSTFDIFITTDEYSDKFTHVDVVEDTYYIDVASIRNWLLNSNSDYLINLSDEITDLGKYVIIAPDEFMLESTYAEDGEYDLSATTSLLQNYRRFHTTLKTIGNMVENTLGNSVIKDNEGNASIHVDGDNSKALIKLVRNSVFDYYNFYYTLIDTFADNGSMTESQYKQAVREIDNRDASLLRLRQTFINNSLSDINLKLDGEITNTTSKDDNFAIESLFNTSFTLNDTNYQIEVMYNRTGDTTDIVAPEGEKTISISELDNHHFITGLAKIVQYFDVFDIDFIKQLDKTPANIEADTLEEFCILVNSLGIYDGYLTEYNVLSYINTYYNYEDTQNVNYRVVHDFVDAMSGVLPNTVMTETTVAKNTEPQYLNSNGTVGNIAMNFEYNPTASDSRLKAWTITINPETLGDTTEFDLTKFNLRTILGSKYPANSKTILKSYGFDGVDLVKESYKVDDTTPVILYFVTENNSGQMDLYYGDNYICQLVNY